MTGWSHELRQALRAIFARPAFSALVVGVLAAGLGCVVFMLALLDGFALRPLPFAEPDRLYQAGFFGDGGLGDIHPMTDQDLVASRRQLAPVAEVGHPRHAAGVGCRRLGRRSGAGPPRAGRRSDHGAAP